MTRSLALRIMLVLCLAFAMAGAVRLHRAPWSPSDVERMAQAQLFGASAVICDVGGHSSGPAHDTRCEACQLFANAVLPPPAGVAIRDLGGVAVPVTGSVITAFRPAPQGPPLPARGPPLRLS